MKRVLLIDDDDEVRDSLTLMLESEGFDVIESNGHQGLQSQDTFPASMVITDMVTLEHEGLEAMQSIRRRWPNAPVIAMSGTVPACDEEAEAFDRLLAPVCLLHKPFTIDEFLATVRTVLPACA